MCCPCSHLAASQHRGHTVRFLLPWPGTEPRINAQLGGRWRSSMSNWLWESWSTSRSCLNWGAASPVTGRREVEKASLQDVRREQSRWERQREDRGQWCGVGDALRFLAPVLPEALYTPALAGPKEHLYPCNKCPAVALSHLSVFANIMKLNNSNQGLEDSFSLNAPWSAFTKKLLTPSKLSFQSPVTVGSKK